MSEFLSQLQTCLGSPLLTGGDIGARYQHDWSAEPAGIPVAVARPGSTDEVAAIMKLCAQRGQRVVVQVACAVAAIRAMENWRFHSNA